MTQEPPSERTTDTSASCEERLHRQRDKLLRIIQHDLRGPLSSISVALDALRDDGLSSNERKRYCDAVQKAVARADRLLYRVVLASQMHSGAYAVKRNSSSLPSCVHGAIATCQPTATEKGIGLEADIASSNEGPMMLADFARLGEAIIELIENALRHAQGTDRVVVRVQAITGELRIGVRDWGTGPRLPDDLLDQFWQDMGKRRGSGIGLAFAFGVARVHGGGLALERHDRGNEFTLTIPALPG